MNPPVTAVTSPFDKGDISGGMRDHNLLFCSLSIFIVSDIFQLGEATCNIALQVASPDLPLILNFFLACERFQALCVKYPDSVFVLIN